MKQIAAVLLFMISATSVCLFSCQNKRTEKDVAEAYADSDEWPEMESFHVLMADVYHPLKDSGDVRPIMARASALADEAAKWEAAPLPSKVDTKEVKELLAKLKTDTRALADQIKAGAAEDVAGTRLTALHELFHQIEEKWYLKSTD